MKRNYMLIVLARAALMFANGLLAWYLPLVIKERFGPGILGLTFSMASMLSTAVGLLGGVLGDNIGRKPVIVLDSILTFSGIVFFVLGYTAEPVLLLLSALALYGFARIGDAVIETVVYESVDEEFLGRALSIMFTAGAIAASMGSIILGHIIKQAAEPAAILLVTSSSLYMLTSILLEETIAEKAGVLGRVSLVYKLKDAIRTLTDGSRLVKEGILLPLIITVLMCLEVGSTLYLYPAFMKEVKGFTQDIMSIIYGVIPLLQAFIYPFAGVIVDKVGAKKAVSLTLFLQAIALTCFVTIAEPLYAGLALVIASGIGAVYNV
ncbi:MAG: MFS transporter, partial [Pyrodictiaceae archaeon]